MEEGDLVVAIDGTVPRTCFPTLHTGQSSVCRHMCHTGDVYRILEILDDDQYRVRNTKTNLTNRACDKCTRPVGSYDEFSFMDW